jgi:hypothetical protein
MRFVSNLLRRTDACASRWFDRGSIFGIWKKNLLDCDSVLPGVAQRHWPRALSQSSNWRQGFQLSATRRNGTEGAIA